MAMNTNPAVPDEDRVPEVQPTTEPAEEKLPVVPAMIRLANEAFLRDFPELLKTHRGQWVAYHGDKCYGFAKDDRDLYRRCRRDGITLDEFNVYPIRPDSA